MIRFPAAKISKHRGLGSLTDDKQIFTYSCWFAQSLEFIKWLGLHKKRTVKVNHNIINGTFNPFVPDAPFLYSLKTSKNLTVFWCFQGVEKGCIRNKWNNPFKVNAPILSKTVNWLHKNESIDFCMMSVLTLNRTKPWEWCGN